MILPDVNVLLYALRADSLDHETCRPWLDGVVNGDARYGISPQVLSGVIRVATQEETVAQHSLRPVAHSVRDEPPRIILETADGRGAACVRFVAWQGTTTSERAYCEGEAGKEKVQWTFTPPNERAGMYALARMA